MTAHRIMIVEDERIVALNLQQRLGKLGYEVTARAASGTEALNKARANPPDLVLMDIHIEGELDGIQTAELLYQELGLRVIYLTAYSEDTTLDRARTTRPYGYLLKPFSERELHATLQMALERRSADLKLADSEERNRLALDSASMGAWELNAERSELKAFGLAGMLMLQSDKGAAVGVEQFLDCVHANERSMVRSAVEQALANGKPCAVEFRQKRADDEPHWVRVVARAFSPGHGLNTRLIGVAQDVTARRANELRLQQAATVFNEAGEGIFILDGDGRLVSTNPAFELMVNGGALIEAGTVPRFLTPKVLSHELHEKLSSQLATHGSWQGEIQAVRANGDLFPAWLSITQVRDTEARIVNQVGILSDFTALRIAQETLRRLAHYDVLTGLPNRTLALERLEQALNRARRRQTRIAVLFVDLDHFKRINDTRGHAMGDLVLREAAERLQSCLRAEDTAARLGGDEFLILVDEFNDCGHAMALAERLRKTLTLPVRAGGSSFQIGASIGIAMFPEDGGTVERLIQAADTAMYECKARGRDGYAFYSAEMTTRVARYLARDQQLRQALANGELRLFYQPLVDVLSGRCDAVEALIRWQHPELGLLGAEDVIPTAEESGLIVEVGAWVLDEACRQIAEWRAQGLDGLRVCVNISPKQLKTGKLSADLVRVLKKHQVEPSALEIEITESSLQNEDMAVATLNEIRRIGVSVAIDDFGTGFSCLSSLHNLPLDRLKIDQSFVRELPAGSGAVLAETVLAIARKLQLRVTAEGVETEEQMAFMAEHGCDSVQGFLFGPAVRPDALALRLLAPGTDRCLGRDAMREVRKAA
ncbi:MAG: two-component system response regulator [Panacagrimonas sp.]